MSGTESELELPKITSTQLSPKKHEFQNKLRGMNINNLLKSKAMALAKKNCVKATFERSQISPLIKQKLMDDERDSSYYSSNDSKKNNAASSSNSDDGDSEGESGDTSDHKSMNNKKTDHKSSGDDNTSSAEKQSNSESSENESNKFTKKKKLTKLRKNISKATISSSDEESDSEDDKPTVKRGKEDKKAKESPEELESSSEEASSEEEICKQQAASKKCDSNASSGGLSSGQQTSDSESEVDHPTRKSDATDKTNCKPTVKGEKEDKETRESSEDSGSSSGEASSEEEKKGKQEDSSDESDSDTSGGTSSGEQTSDSESDADKPTTKSNIGGREKEDDKAKESSEESGPSSGESTSTEEDPKSKAKICEDKQARIIQKEEISGESDSELSSDKSNSGEINTDSESDQPTSKFNTTYKTTNETDKVLASYVQMHNLQPVPMDDAFDLGELSDNDEFFLVNIAKDINPASLMNAKLTLEKKQILNVAQSKDKLNLEFDKDDKNKLCLLGKLHNKYGIRHFKTSGSITVTKTDVINIVDVKPKTVKPKGKVPFPVDKIRVRHPLFGRNYEPKITLDEDVSKKLDNLIENLAATYMDNYEDDGTDLDKVDVEKGNKKLKKKKSDNLKNNLDVNEKSGKRKKKTEENIASILSSFGDTTIKKVKKEKSKSKLPLKEQIPLTVETEAKKSLSLIKGSKAKNVRPVKDITSKEDEKEQSKSKFPQKEVILQKNKRETSLSPIKEVKAKSASPVKDIKIKRETAPDKPLFKKDGKEISKSKSPQKEIILQNNKRITSLSEIKELEAKSVRHMKDIKIKGETIPDKPIAKDKKEKSKCKSPQKEIILQNRKKILLSPINKIQDKKSSFSETPKKKTKKVREEDSADDFRNPPPTQPIYKKLSKLMSSTMNSPNIYQAAFDLNESIIPIPEKKKRMIKDESNSLIIKEEIVPEPVRTSHKKKKKRDKKAEEAPKSVIKTPKETIELDKTLMNLITETIQPIKEPSSEKKEAKKRKRRHSTTVTAETNVKQERKETAMIKKRRPTMI